MQWNLFLHGGQLPLTSLALDDVLPGAGLPKALVAAIGLLKALGRLPGLKTQAARAQAQDAVRDSHELYRRYGPALLRKAQRVLRNHEDARDVLQNLFTDLLEDGPQSPDLAYLYRAITNRCLNLIRDHKTHARLLAREDQGLRGPTRLSCEARVIDLDRLLKLASRLDAESHAIVVYRYLDDLGLEEIAELTGLSRKTVAKRLDQVREAVLALDAPNAGQDAP